MKIFTLFRIVFIVFPLLTSCAGGVEGSIDLLIIDESHKPVAGALVRVSNVGESGASEGRTDTDGKVSLPYHSYPEVMVTKEGFYWQSVRERDMVKWMRDPGSNSPLVIYLKKITNPVPMYVRKLKLKMPEEAKGKIVGLDLVRGQWTSPYGTGENSDINVVINGFDKSYTEYEYKLSMDFQGDGSGIQRFSSTDQQQLSSQIWSPLLAPVDGYAKVLTWESALSVSRGIDRVDRQWVGVSYMFRVRPRTTAAGVSEYMYGKTIGSFCVEKDKLTFYYYLNPSYTRSLEWDQKTNLAEKNNLLIDAP